MLILLLGMFPTLATSIAKKLSRWDRKYISLFLCTLKFQNGIEKNERCCSENLKLHVATIIYVTCFLLTYVINTQNFQMFENFLRHPVYGIEIWRVICFKTFSLKLYTETSTVYNPFLGSWELVSYYSFSNLLWCCFYVLSIIKKIYFLQFFCIFKSNKRTHETSLFE